ncbi:PREDICTED: metabotropic glutamate receptor-like [Priapulus caudatus]|uniref:Metabotropic glutamate receptor-like n=1 Tax=Priapulus caudatus TaxID=37621 RepID=A0ABM1E119_PRICU|nr:PREDICTED: metabotropic glutamate receptor-like [Priapulus caudatus]
MSDGDCCRRLLEMLACLAVLFFLSPLHLASGMWCSSSSIEVRDSAFDFNVGGLFPLRRGNQTGTHGSTACDVVSTAGVQQMMAAVYALRRVREKHGLSIGLHAVDACGGSGHQLAGLLRLMQQYDDATQCRSHATPHNTTRLFGVLSSYVDDVTSDLLDTLRLPNVAYTMTGAAASNAINMSVDDMQFSFDKVQAIVQLLKSLKVRQITAVFVSADPLRAATYRMFRTLAESAGLCVRGVYAFSDDPQTDELASFFETLTTDGAAQQAVLLFVNGAEATQLEAAARRSDAHALAAVTWIALDRLPSVARLPASAIVIVGDPGRPRPLADDFRRFFVDRLRDQMPTSDVVREYVREAYGCRTSGDGADAMHCNAQQ